MRSAFGFVLYAALTAAAESGVPVEVLRPDGFIDFPAEAGARMVAFRTSGERLYALIATRTRAELIRLERDGTGLNRIDVPQRTADFAISGDGEVTVLVSGRGRDASAVAGPFFSTARPYTELRVSRATYRLSVLADRVVALHDAIAEPLDRTIETRDGLARIAAGPLLRSAPMPDGSIAFVSTRGVSLRVLRPNRQWTGLVPLAAPEILSEEELGETGVAVAGIGVHPQGDVFCAVSPYSPAEGARVLRFDSAGKLKARLRLAIPGGMPAGHLAFVGSRLYAGSPAGRLAYFDLRE